MSATYTVTRDDIITLAARRLGILDLGGTLDASTLNEGVMLLNLILKQLATNGLKIWTITDYTLTLTTGKKDYIIGPGALPVPDLVASKPLKLIQARMTNITNPVPTDVNMQLLSRNEYNLLGSKTALGMINAVFFEVKDTYSIVHTFLDPAQIIVDQWDLVLTVQTTIDDALSGSASVSFPVEWYNYLVWKLADEWSIQWGCPANLRAEISTKAMFYEDQLNGWDVENTSTYFQADRRLSANDYGTS